MKTNIGTTDRIMRILITAILVIMYLSDILSGTWGYLVLGLAAPLLVASMIRFCSMYIPLGLNPCSKIHSNTHYN